jgi:hypothetical protein
MARSQLSRSASANATAPVYRLFKDRPTRLFINEFLEHVRKTGTPETSPDVHPGPIPKSARFFTLAAIEIERKKRPDLDKAPCPMCQPNKFLSGSLVWLPELHAIAAIGHCCADKTARDAADREYAARRARDEQEDYLLSRLPLIRPRMAALDKIAPVAAEVDRVYRKFRSAGGCFQKRLRAVNRQQGGRLILTETIGGEIASIGPAGFRGAGSSVNTRDIEIGVLAGTTALISDYSPSAELGGVRRPFSAHDCQSNDEAVLNYIVSLSDTQRHRAVVELREAERAYERLIRRLNDFREFFSARNIERLNAWSSHNLNPEPFTASFERSRGCQILLMKSQKEEFRVVLNPGLWTICAAWPEADAP